MNQSKELDYHFNILFDIIAATSKSWFFVRNIMYFVVICLYCNISRFKVWQVIKFA